MSFSFPQGESQEEKAAKSAAKREARMQSVLRALGVLASSSGVAAERQAFLELVRHLCGLCMQTTLA